ncbi:tyrosine-protein kinase HCK-like [Ruditapes philippinarum]|uniref:tyrosine-protein kinase HCK-like n=1 Tax=Ruditapes philippinarum TaxID=129788 RepID=UPI00295BCEDC|nr:tyrosine-protein kinase HCK-like [Ruditapes philippinarum]
MDEQCAKKSIETFNLKKIQNHWFIEAGGKMHHLGILNNVDSVHMDENVIFADESMYQVIVKDNGELKIDKIEDLCTSIGEKKEQPDKEKHSADNEGYDSDCDSEDASGFSKYFLKTGQKNVFPEEDQSDFLRKFLKMGLEEYVSDEEDASDYSKYFLKMGQEENVSDEEGPNAKGYEINIHLDKLHKASDYSEYFLKIGQGANASEEKDASGFSKHFLKMVQEENISDEEDAPDLLKYFLKMDQEENDSDEEDESVYSDYVLKMGQEEIVSDVEDASGFSKHFLKMFQEENTSDEEDASDYSKYFLKIGQKENVSDENDASDYSEDIPEIGQEDFVPEKDASGTDQQLEMGSEEIDIERKNKSGTEIQLEMGSEEFVPEGETDMNMTILVTALYDFNARLDNEISFKAEDVFITFRRNLKDSNIWMKATHQRSGEKGFIPRNYVVTDFKKYYLKDWWHDLNKRETVSQLSAPHFGLGAFIIRTASDKMSLALSVRESEMGENTVKIQHYRIYWSNDGRFRLSEEDRLFADMTALIQYYQDHLINGLCCRLGEQVAKTIPDVPFRDLESQAKLVTIRQNVGPNISTGEWRNRGVTIKQSSQLEIKHFLTEIDILKRLKHDKIINLLAVITKEKPFLMVFDMITIGTLSDYLRKDMGKTIKHDQLLDMAIQISKGMDYLCNEQIVHRDLRTGHILVGQVNKLKIAGFGMAKRLQNDCYVSLDKERLAIKWTAPEVFNERKFTTQSDVWAFGVLLYEMITFGKLPYPGMSNDETESKVIEGYRMKMPDDGHILCPRELYDIMLHCWDKIPTKRPTFLNIIVSLNKYATKPHLSETETKTSDRSKIKTKTEKDTKNACVSM